MEIKINLKVVFENVLMGYMLRIAWKSDKIFR